MRNFNTRGVNHRHLLKHEATSSDYKIIVSFCTTAFAYVVMVPWFGNSFFLLFHLIVVFFGVQHSQHSDEFRISYIKEKDVFMKRNESSYKTFLYPCFSRGWRGEMLLKSHGKEVKLYGSFFGILVVLLVVIWCVVLWK